MNGFIVINKPVNMTSFDVIYRLRKKLNIKKLGHFGTLDPMADGVLPVSINSAGRLFEYLKSDKKYIATIKFGEISSTFDVEGEITKISEPNFSPHELNEVLKTFSGKIEQYPPIYSAVKVNGKKLYEYARKNEEVEIKKREVEIYGIKVLEFNLPIVKIEFHVSKGTYIRSLANDIGKKMKTGAYLLNLTRTCAGKFKLDMAESLECEEFKIINPIDVLDFRQYELNEEEYIKINNGNSIFARNISGDEFLSLVYHNNLVAISRLCDKIIKVEKVLR